ncbi:hypothetical protein SASPL_133846 [Salvia splendens]|uniref:Uncharacterized protein n=1 Tax=Salvia splendens TaxID=180675 RepID=A0A8X8ZIF0_SALSN|nr:hypothetical protein SASPL_133846 [Salvia splendens]
MVVLVEKLGRSLNFPPSKPKPLDPPLKSAALADFRSKIAEFVAGIGSELLSLKGFDKCFDLIHTSNSAFAELAIQIDYPMRQWGPCLTAEYLSCTSDLLSLSNAVTSSVSHLSYAKMRLLRLLHALTTSPAEARHAAPPQQKIKFEKAITLEERATSRQEQVLLEALILCRKLGLLALGLIVSGLCGDAEAYVEMRGKAGGIEIDDPLLKEVDSRFSKAAVGVVVMEEVREVEMGEGVEEVKRRLKVMEDSLQRINTQTDHLFSQLLSARNEVIASIRFPE